MLTTVTPREAMTFSARLRLPASTSPETITQLVDGTFRLYRERAA